MLISLLKYTLIVKKNNFKLLNYIFFSLILSLFTISTVKADTGEDIAFILGIGFLVVLIYTLPAVGITYFLQGESKSTSWPNLSSELCAKQLENVVGFNPLWLHIKIKVLDAKIRILDANQNYHSGGSLLPDDFIVYLFRIQESFCSIFLWTKRDSEEIAEFFSSMKSLFGPESHFSFMYTECSKVLLLHGEDSLHLELVKAFSEIQDFINAGIVSKELVYTFIDNISLILIFIVS